MNDSGLVDHCLELLSPLGPTRSSRMFGGHALYIDDLCVALVFRDALYLKVDDAHRAAFVAAHCQPFIYETKNGDSGSLSYYTAPDEAMESPHEMIPWARRAIAAALAARAKATPNKKKAPPAKTSAKVATRKAAVKKTPAPAAKKPVAAKAAVPRKTTPAARSRTSTS